ncbi:MAG: hypothetical protein A2X86_00745 [Bdellovibrionales bacterium GWA2_49_15]|nr:MAG: hypothetical protein A2X86_00745 [Bdellovibrionales bacterium GWA2_49_15]HAZ14611.1 hypothetical protein [Bdellovibrionales bacterium]
MTHALDTQRNSFFYKVANHSELFRVGGSYLEDFKKGVKSFAITSLGQPASQQKTILGLASFFDHQLDLKIGIISDNLFLGPFKTIVQASSATEMELNNGQGKIAVHRFHGHFSFIDLEDLIDQAYVPESDFPQTLKALIAQFDLVFWDVPELHKIHSAREDYDAIISCFEGLSIIVAKGHTRKEDIERVHSFFEGYGIPLKGFLLETPKIAAKKSRWWQGWFA